MQKLKNKHSKKQNTLADGIRKITGPWAKQRRAEERGTRRSRSGVWSTRTTLKEAAYTIMPEAYKKASDYGRYPALARQIMYAARPYILEATGKDSFRDNYFTCNLLPNYMLQHSGQCEHWDVIYDARGHMAEPHTKLILPLGTLEVRNYVEEVKSHTVKVLTPDDFHLTENFPTVGPIHRFQAILFIEKEGFLPLLEKANLAARYDIAVMSSKGMPVVAARYLVDQLCGNYDFPMLVVRDFDKAGFSIAATLANTEYVDDGDSSSPRRLPKSKLNMDRFYDDYSDDFAGLFNPTKAADLPTRRYEYRHDFNVFDLGLRLQDVEANNLESEVVSYQSYPEDNLRENGATEEEIDFLCGYGLSGHRVELNAFMSSELIQWLEDKLEEHGIAKVIPDDDALEDAYRRCHTIVRVNQRINTIVEEEKVVAQHASIPDDLRQDVIDRLDADPTIPWDEALAEIVTEQLGRENNQS